MEPAVRSDLVGEPAATRALEERLGHRFRDPELLRTAMTHPSATGAPDGPREHYERLEFLGDRVLGLIVADMLFAAFPRESEGALSRRLAALVRRETLVEVAETIGLGDVVSAAEGVADSRGLGRDNLLADACEALIAAVYLDAGLDAARRFVEPAWGPLLRAATALPRDPKTRLQEWLQGRGLPLPVYAIVARSGPDHAPSFRIEARTAAGESAAGEGPSKRIAEQAAASALLERLEAHA